MVSWNEHYTGKKSDSAAIAWRFTGIGGLKRFLTQHEYDLQTNEIKSWYEPYRCANCQENPSRSQQYISDMEDTLSQIADAVGLQVKDADLLLARVKELHTKVQALDEHRQDVK